MRRGIAFGGALLALVACAEKSPEHLSIALLGEEAWLKGQGGGPKPVFTRSRLPRFSLRGGRCEPRRVELEDRARRFDAELLESEHAGLLFLHTRTTTRPAPGPGAAMLYCDGRRVFDAELEWRPASEELGVRERLGAEFDDARDARSRIADLWSSPDIWTRVYSEHELARFYRGRGRLAEADRTWLSAVHAASEAGEAMLAERMAYPRVFAKYNAGDLDGAQAALDALPVPPSFDRARSWHAHFEGQIAAARGDLYVAENALIAASRLAAEQGELTDHELSVLELSAVLATQGRWNDTLVALGGLDRESSAFPRSDLTRATLHNMVGWTALAAEQSGGLSVDPQLGEGNLRTARDLAVRAGYADAIGHATVNLALWYLAYGDAKSAREALRAFAAPELQGGSARPFVELALAEAALLEGELAAALAALDRLIAELERGASFESEIRWRAEHLRGRVYVARGAPDEAETALRRAVEILRTDGEKLPGELGRLHALWRRKEPALDLIDLLDRSGRSEEAFWVADELHAAKLRALSAAAGGAPAADAPAARETPALLPPRVAVLSMLATKGSRWTALLLERGRARILRGADPIAELLPELSRLERLYVVPGGDRRAFDLLTSTSSTGTPLGARVEISLLPNAGVLFGAEPLDGPPLVVADPNLDLPGAKREGAALARDLGSATLLGGAEATRDAVRARWKAIGLFHFAGHGAIDARRPWDAHLRLHDRPIDLRDVLLDRPRPSLVVLSACESGVEMEPTRINLAEAFLHAGAGAVLGTIREVEDRAAQKFVETFYRHGAVHDPHRAFRRAIEEGVARGDQTWKAFRLWGGHLRRESEDRR